MGPRIYVYIEYLFMENLMLMFRVESLLKNNLSISHQFYHFAFEFSRFLFFGVEQRERQGMNKAQSQSKRKSEALRDFVS